MPLSLKARGELAELRVAGDLVSRGYKVAFPFGEAWQADLIVYRRSLERVQVKYVASNGRVVTVRCRHQSLTNGKVRSTRRYTAATVDWMAVYDSTTDRCYYVPAAELGAGRSQLHLRLDRPRNGQRLGIRMAADYLDI